MYKIYIMTDRYWREIEDVENDIENAMQISSILLKLKGYDANLEKIDDNENNISSNLGKIDNNENNISNNLEKIDNISEFILKSDKDFEKTYNIEPQTFRFNKDKHFFNILEEEIEHDFIKNSLLFIKNNMYYKYDDLEDDYHRCQHEYNIYDDNNNLIHKYLFNKDTYYNENSDILKTNEEFCILLKQDYNKIKIVLELHRHNRHGFGNINLEIDKNNNYIKIEYIERGILDNSHLVNLNTGSISTNLGKIITNTSDISDNKDLITTNTSTISDIEKGVELLIEPYNETFPLSNRTITTNRQILFEKIIDFDFSELGVFNILTTCNYDKYNFTHEYHFLNNDELIFKKSIDVLSTKVKDEFEFKSIDISSLKIKLYLTNANEKISLFDKNSLQFRYSKIKFKTDINENNIKKNLEKINEKSELIDTNKRDISFNLGLISNIKSNSTIIHDDVYNETFILSNRNITTQSQIIFKKIINFDFSNNGFFNILTVCNYDKKYNFNHKYRFFNNDELLKDVIIPMTSNVVKDEFKFEGIGDVSSLKIELYITDNFNNETIKLLSNSSLQFKYSKIEFKTDINENNIKTNLGKINTNTSSISSNLGKINTNTSSISTNLGKINTNTSSILNNKGLIELYKSKINNMENNLIEVDDVYNETFIISNKTILSTNELIFEKIINFDFSKGYFFNILATYNYDKKYNFNHIYYFYNNNNLKLLKKETISVNMVSNIVKHEFSFESIDVQSLKILIMYESDNDQTIKLFGNNSFQFKYHEINFKMNKIEGNISSNKDLIDANASDILDNLGKINTNTSSISTNLGKINDNKDDIIALKTSNIKAFYNLDQIFIYDIEKGNQTVDKDNHFHIFEKGITYNFIKNSYLEIALKVLTEISNYVLIGFFQILCNFYDQDNNLFYTISLSTAMGSINKLSTIKSVFIVPINEHMSKIKIDFFIAPKETQQNRSAKFTIQDINSNKIYVKYFQKTDEMSIKDIQDSLNSVKNINLEQIDKNKNDITDNLGKINNITKTIMLKNTYFTDFNSTDETIYNGLLRLDGTTKKNVNMFNLDMGYDFKKDDFIEIDCKIILNHNSYDDAKNLALYFELYEGIKALQNKLIFRESRRYNQFPIVLNKDRIIVYTKLCYKVKYDIINIKFRIQLQSLYAKTVLILNHEIIPNGSNYIFIKHYGN